LQGCINPMHGQMGSSGLICCRGRSYTNPP
jgi:hypothetical protein